MWHIVGAGPPSLPGLSLFVSWYEGTVPTAAQCALLPRSLPLRDIQVRG
jgi:hypothetical protein